MNKKLFLSLFLTLTLSAIFAQNADFKRYYDSDQDFEGYAQAEYLDKFDVEALSAFFDKLEGETLSDFLNNEPDVVSAPIQKRIKETFLPKIEELNKTDSSEAYLGSLPILLPILLLGAMLTANQGAMENLAEPSPTPPVETPDADQKPMGNIELIPVSKLTKNNKWLMEQALNEWDLSSGEVYLVTCAKTRYGTSGLVILVGITSPEDYEYRPGFWKPNKYRFFPFPTLQKIKNIVQWLVSSEKHCINSTGNTKINYRSIPAKFDKPKKQWYNISDIPLRKVNNKKE